MTPEELKNRTKDFALKTIRLVEALPKGKTADIIRNATANVRNVGRGKLSVCMPGAIVC